MRPGFPLLADPAGHAYAAYGLRRGRFAQLFGLAVLGRALAATLRGHIAGPPAGDAFLLPGAFVIDPGGRIRLAHYARHIADHARADRLLAALPPA
jgi:peroxiredoxin